MQIFEIESAQAQLDHLIDLALAGEDIVIARCNRPLVRLIPVRHGFAEQDIRNDDSFQ